MCLYHSPLTLVLSNPKNGVQDKEREDLINLLVKWGSGTVCTTINYKIHVVRDQGDSYKIKVKVAGRTMESKNMKIKD